MDILQIILDINILLDFVIQICNVLLVLFKSVTFNCWFSCYTSLFNSLRDAVDNKDSSPIWCFNFKSHVHVFAILNAHVWYRTISRAYWTYWNKEENGKEIIVL